jgi:hypothetical protein
MRDLIKKILSEYKEDYFSITFHSEIVDGLLFEMIYPSRKEIKKLGYVPEPISDEEESLVKNYLDIINKGNSDLAVNKNEKGNGILGIFESKLGKKNEIIFEIELTDHWFFRLHRTKDPVSKKYPGIIDPNPLECINLINRKINELAKFVVNKKPYKEVRWQVNGPNRLSFIMIFENQNLDEDKYKLIVINQIKGVDFFDVVSKNKIPLY